MKVEIITENETLLIRRLVLEPKECMYWYTDSCKRFTVVIRGFKSDIEFRETDDVVEIDAHLRMADWDEPEPKALRT